jgi:hypothetical protein
MGGRVRAIAARIGAWPTGVKVAALVVVALLVVAAVAVPVTLRLRAQPAASARRAPGRAPTPTPAPILSPGAQSLAADLTCRLPISSFGPGSGGFIGFPSGSFTSDPGSSTPAFQRQGTNGLTYDRAIGKWLAVPYLSITPDGGRFVYWNGQEADFHVVEVTTNAEVAIGPRSNGPAWQAASAARFNNPYYGPSWTLLDAAADGVYATPPSVSAGPAAGLWFFPYAGAERQVASFGYWQAVGGGAAWGTSAPSVPQGATVTIVRLDLSSGASTSWFSQDGESAQVAGFDASGHPVVVTSTEEAVQVWVVDGPQHGTRVLDLPQEPQSGYRGPIVQSVAGDANGVWIAVHDGLYLYRNGSSQQVSTVTGQLGGGCAA